MSTVIVGAGQAGLAAAHHLSQRGQPTRIITADRQVGDTWRNRWDSLRLFTPAFYNELPGMPFPASNPDHLPLKDEVADYLQAYADRLDVPIKLGTRVTRVAPDNQGPYRPDQPDQPDQAAQTDQRERIVLETDDGTVRCRNVVLATGAYRTPSIPPFAPELDPDLVAIHSSEYRNPDALPAGDVLVVGAGNSGTQIATELARARPSRTVYLSGRDTGRLPRRILGIDIYRWLGPTLLRIRRDSFLGRRLSAKMNEGGDPVFNTEHAAMVEAGVRRVGRITGVTAGRPVVADGGTLDVSAVVWATGYRNEYDWLDAPAALEDGRPVHARGVSPVPGLYFLGLRYLYRPDSSLIAGVGEDARYIARRIADDDG